MSYEKIPYANGDSTVSLRGPSAQRLDLMRDGKIAIQWSPMDKRTMDLEVRMRVIGTRGMAYGESPPVVQYSAQISQGQFVWDDPPINFPCETSTTFGLQASTLPDRGAVLRVPARELRLVLFSPRRLDGSPALESVTVSVSFCPSNAMGIDVWPDQQSYPIDAIANSKAAAIPIGATEWRAYGPVPSLPLVGALTIATLSGQPLTFVPLADLANWTSIPVHAFAFHSVDGPFDVAFR